MEDTQRNYKKALEKGVLKILSKMGISLLSCYHGAQIFEIYGLGQDIVDTAFRGSVSRIGGMTFDDLQKEVESFWVKVGLCSAAHFPVLLQSDIAGIPLYQPGGISPQCGCWRDAILHPSVL